LKMVIVETPLQDFRSRILSLAENRKWKTEKNDELGMIFKTIPIRGYHEYIEHNRHEGERIYVFVEQNRVYLKSIDNLDNIGFKIHKGDNLANEQVLVNTIKSQIR